MKKEFLMSIAALICCNAYSQSYNNNWVFGDSAGLNFTTGTPIAFHSQIRSLESCASISDSLGNLLFYTNGEKIWNRNNEIMPNGDSLHIGQLFLGSPSSITQGILIIPKPGSDHIYYTIQMQYQNSPSTNYGLEYSMVDVNLDGGLGDVILKNQELFSGATWQKMQAVKHGNGRDWWIVVHSDADIDTAMCFIRFLATPDSIEGPFYQCYENTDVIGDIGQMKFSHEGNKLGFTRRSNLDIYDFDRCSGLLSNQLTITIPEAQSFYGCEFSDDGREMYVTTTPTITNSGSLYQYCLSCPGVIDDNKDTLYVCTFEEAWMGQLQIAPNSKIYLTISNSGVFDESYNEHNKFLSVINNPNLVGTACDFDTLSIPLIASRGTCALPNMPNYNLGPLKGSECDTLLTMIQPGNLSINNELSIYPNPASNCIYIGGDINQASSKINVQINNILGQKVYDKSNVSLNQAIDLPNLKNGEYELIVKRENAILFSGKLIISR